MTTKISVKAIASIIEFDDGQMVVINPDEKGELSIAKAVSLVLAGKAAPGDKDAKAALAPLIAADKAAAVEQPVADVARPADEPPADEPPAGDAPPADEAPAA